MTKVAPRTSFWLLACLHGLWLAGASPAAPPKGPANLDLEEGDLGQVPTGWFFPPLSAEAGYSAELTDDRPKSGKRCALLSRDRKDGPAGFGNLMQTFDATAYRGKRVRLRAAVRVQGAGA